ALKNKGQQQKIAALVARNNGVNDKFWHAVATDRGITARERETLKNYAAVNDILGKDADLLERVSEHLTKRGGKITPAALTNIKREDWSKLIEDTIRANWNNPVRSLGSKELKAFAEGMANTIARKIAARFPTETLQSELAASPRTGY